MDQDHICVFVRVRAVPPHDVRCKAVSTIYYTTILILYSIATTNNKSIHRCSGTGSASLLISRLRMLGRQTWRGILLINHGLTGYLPNTFCGESSTWMRGCSCHVISSLALRMCKERVMQKDEVKNKAVIRKRKEGPREYDW